MTALFRCIERHVQTSVDKHKVGAKNVFDAIANG
jgi:hypothetical protein